MISHLFPAVVRDRMPAIPSLRKALSDLRERSVPQKPRDANGDAINVLFPPCSYTPRPGSASSFAGNSATGLSLGSTDSETLNGEDVFERPESVYSTPPIFFASESKTGINWKYANQGSSLFSQAHAESHTLSQRDDETTTIFTRQLYIHSLTYFLRGLPSDLTAQETLSLQAAIPESLVPVRVEPCTHTMMTLAHDGTITEIDSGEPSLLHRVTAILVFRSFVLMQFLLPYIKLLISHAYQFEREHRITQRLVSNGIMTADSLRRTSLQFSRTVCQMNDGKVGKALNDVALWWVAGLTGGLQQGIREGVLMLSNDNRTEMKDGRKFE